MSSSQSNDQRQRTLLIEFELPTFYCDDLPELIAEHGWPDEPVSDQILRDIGEIYGGLLTVEVMGEKDSEIERVPVIARAARIEDRPPTPESQHENMRWLAERVDEPQEEARILAACDHAALRVYERLIRQLSTEYTGQVSELAKQALQEAAHAESEAEKREAERSGVFG